MTTPPDAPGEERVGEIRRRHTPYQWDQYGNGICRVGQFCETCFILTYLDALQQRVREVERERDSACENWARAGRVREVERERDSACENWARAGSRAEEAEYKLTHAEQRVEQMIVQMAGVSTAAMGWIREPAKEGDYVWSVPYEDVLKLRRKFDLAEQRVAALEGALGEASYAVRRAVMFGVPNDEWFISVADECDAALAPPQAGPKEHKQ